MLMMGLCFRSRRFFPGRRMGELLGVIIIFIFNRYPAYHDVYAGEVMRHPRRGRSGKCPSRTKKAFDL